MGRCDDVVQKARASASNLRFAEALALARCLGFALRDHKGKSNASHRFFTRPGYPEVINLQPDRSGKAKAYQVRQMLRIYDDLQGER
ncbi:MAG: hypothetical protein ACNA8N_13480 [Trueperaceae bacterium]